MLRLDFLQKAQNQRVKNCFFIYPLKDYNINLQATLLHKISMLDSYKILLEQYPEEQKTMTTPGPLEHRD